MGRGLSYKKNKNRIRQTAEQASAVHDAARASRDLAANTWLRGQLQLAQRLKAFRERYPTASDSERRAHERIMLDFHGPNGISNIAFDLREGQRRVDMYEDRMISFPNPTDK